MTPDRSQVETDILTFIRSRIPGHSDLAADTDLLEDSLMDSLLLMDLIFQIEDRYGIKLGSDQINPSNFRNATTIADLVLAQANSAPV